MYMKKSLSLTLSFVAVAVLAMVASLCFVFLGNKVIDEIPSTLNVEMVEGDYLLVATFNGQYKYQFKIEQMIDGKFSVVSTVKSDKNVVNLSKETVSVVAGEKYRFSACYATENGAGNGDYCSAIEWCPEWHLQSVDYSKVQFDSKNRVLSWDSVYLADSYMVNFVDLQGNVVTRNVVATKLDVSGYDVGNYRVFVVAKSKNNKLFNSSAGKGIEIVLQKQNVIENALVDADAILHFQCSQNVKAFQIFVEKDIVAEFECVGTLSGGKYTYSFENLKVVFANVDFENSLVEIVSLEEGLVSQSDYVQVKLV